MWDNAFVIRDSQLGDVVVVPLHYDKAVNFKSNFNNWSTFSLEKQSNLWIYKDDFGKYMARVKITLPDKKYQEGVSKTFAGFLFEEDWLGNMQATYLFKDGKMSLLKKDQLPKNGENAVNRVGDYCYIVDWYICEYITNGIGYNCQFLYSDFIPCEGGDDDDGQGGGGGGGYGDGFVENNICMMTNEQAQAVLNSITASIVTNGTSEIGQATIPDANGIIRKPVVVKRHSINYTFPGGMTATYTLFFPGVIFKTTTNSTWKWESLSFQNIVRTAGTNPACLSASVSAAAQSVAISTDKTKADFQVEISADLEVSCLGGWVISTKHDTINGTYYAFEFQ